jgi:crotonobetainyl-CoA:carnitine CoA-transferase CaiB-like acyl-CoA transferase
MNSQPIKHQTNHGIVGPLAGIRVLDLTRIMAGPWATQTLADLGAEVIKIERPGVGDDTRFWGPPFLKDKNQATTSESAYFMAVNRGKKSVTLDITTPEGRKIVRDLAVRSDILLETFKTDELARYGLSYEDLKPINPALIYCSITGFGQTGPYRHRRGYDFAIQGMGGLMSVTGRPDDEPGGGPEKVGVAVVDIMAGMYATVAVLSALARRTVTGAGQHIDIALLDVQVAMMANQNMNYLISGVAPKRLGNAHPNIVPYQSFATLDGHVILTVGNDAQFVSFCAVARREDLSQDDRFRTNPARVSNRHILIPILDQIMVSKASQDWLTLLEAAGVPCAPINTLEEVFANEQVQHRGMKIELPHLLSGTVPAVVSPMSFSGTPLVYRDPAPLLGQHTDEVLKHLAGRSEDDIASLRQRGVI